MYRFLCNHRHTDHDVSSSSESFAVAKSSWTGGKRTCFLSHLVLQRCSGRPCCCCCCSQSCSAQLRTIRVHHTFCEVIVQCQELHQWHRRLNDAIVQTGYVNNTQQPEQQESKLSSNIIAASSPETTASRIFQNRKGHTIGKRSLA